MRVSGELKKIFMTFSGLEISISTGALLGVGVLDWSWVFGLGLFNLKIAVVVGFFPALLLAILLGKQKKFSYRMMTVVFCVVAFVVSFGLSLILGSAMVGI
jgi:hypothetical protein